MNFISTTSRPREAELGRDVACPDADKSQDKCSTHRALVLSLLTILDAPPTTAELYTNNGKYHGEGELSRDVACPDADKSQDKCSTHGALVLSLLTILDFTPTTAEVYTSMSIDHGEEAVVWPLR